MVDALIVIDMIRAYAKDIKRARGLVRNQLRLIGAFNRRGLPVLCAIPGSKRRIKNPIMLALWGDELKGDALRKHGQRKGDLIPELQRIVWTKTIPKSEYSAFYRTDLERFCKTKRISTLYFCGVYSGVCVHYSAVDAAYRRIWPYLVTDATATARPAWHKENIKRFTQVIGKTITTKDLLKKMNG